MSDKTIVIVGATGIQGSAVAKVFLQLPKWRVRCITRSSSSTKANALSSQGAELVEANLDDGSSLINAFAGADAIFLNTDFWATYHATLKTGKTSSGASQDAYEVELQWGKNAVQAAAKITSLECFVFSALASMKNASGGKYPNGLHWESKAAIIDCIRNEYPVLFAKTSLIYVGAYASNAFFRPQLDRTMGKYIAILPTPKTTRCPIIDAGGPAMGQFVRALVEDEPIGTKLLAVEQNISFESAFEAWRRVTGKDYECIESTLEDVHDKTGVPLEVLEVPAFLAEHSFTAGVAGVLKPAELKARIATRTFEEYLRSLSQEELLDGSENSLADVFTK